MSVQSADPRLRRAVLLVAVLNLACFGVGSGVATATGSVPLSADGVGFLEDTVVNLLIVFGPGALAVSPSCAAGLFTAFVGRSAWPDLAVGLVQAAMNADAAKEVWKLARAGHREAAP